MNIKLGIASKLYIDTAANFASPTFTEVSAFGDVQLNAAWDTVEAPTRASRVKSEAKTLLALGVTGKLRCDDANTLYNTIINSFLSPTGNIGVMILDGSSSTNGARGFRFDAIVKQANQDQALANALFQDLSFMPDAFSGNNYQSVVITSGSPAFTNL